MIGTPFFSELANAQDEPSLSWRRQRLRAFFIMACLAVLLTFCLPCVAQQTTTSPSALSEASIDTLQKKLTDAGLATTTVRKRRAYKNVARNGANLLETSPADPNRWRVLEVIFQARKHLLGLENSERNLKALLETCAKLTEAPDKHAELRLEADLLLSEKALSDKGATLKERVKAIEVIIERYRGTPAEAKSLMMAAQIAPKLQAPELQRRVLDVLGERFAGDPGVIAFRRRHRRLGRLDVLFAGTYTRADNVVMRFPNDLMGRLSIMVFWSQDTPGAELYLKQVKELQVKYPGRFDVFSFNLDELPDAGTAALGKLGLDWTVMRLPGGRKSKAFRSYAQNDPASIFVNAYGHALLSPKGTQVEKFEFTTGRISDERYLAQLQSLFIGDFLVTAGPDERLTPKLAAIQKCFITAPFRYRLKPEQALANYTKAAKLCADAIKAEPKADLSAIRNRRIIALMGMWNLAGEPKYLAQAVKEAKAALAMKLPPGADVVARFCLAKDTLRMSEAVKMESVVSAFLADCGGAEAPASAVAAATILALDANVRDLHERTRATLLAIPDGKNPALWPVVSFLRDRIHIYRLWKGNGLRGKRGAVRGYMVNHGAPPTTKLLPTVTLKTLDGRTLTLPRDTKGKLTLLVFVEPSAEPNAEFPIDADEKGTDRRGHSLLRYACNLADSHVNKDVVTIAAFLSEDAERIEALMKTRKLTCQAAIVPGGLVNPMVRRLGVLLADRVPNVFLLRRDGSIAWHTSGLPYEDSSEFVSLLAMKVHIEVCEVNTAYEALKKGNFKEAVRVFSGPYLPGPPDRYGWRAPRYHGQALGNMGLKDWDAALESIDKAIDAQKLRYFRGMRYDKNAANWRKEAATVTINHPDSILVELWEAKATILEKLGRAKEAQAAKKYAAQPPALHIATLYDSFHSKLKKIRLSQLQGK
jgi:hypothetical protein